MKRGGPIARKTPLRAHAPLQRRTALVARTPMRSVGRPKRSDAPNRSASWLDAVRAIGRCMRCGRYGDVEAAHQNEGKGVSRKVADCWTAALCHTYHAEIDNGSTMTLDQRRTELRRTVRATIEEMFKTGAIGALMQERAP